MTAPLIHLAQVDSTQAFVLRHPELGACGVLADQQIAGRGRGDNTWESAPGTGLWFSARLPLPDLPVGLILQRAMAALMGLLPAHQDRLGLKWPNDLVARIDGRLCKLGGIIGEIKGRDMVLGLGLNLTAAPSLPERAFPAACLADLKLGPCPAVTELATGLLDRWTRLSEAPAPAFLWPDTGEAIRWEDGEGLCHGWEPDGRLKVHAAGRTRLLTAGDLRGLTP